MPPWHQRLVYLASLTEKIGKLSGRGQSRDVNGIIVRIVVIIARICAYFGTQTGPLSLGLLLTVLVFLLAFVQARV